MLLTESDYFLTGSQLMAAGGGGDCIVKRDLIADIRVESEPHLIAQMWRELEPSMVFTPYQSSSFYLSWITNVSPLNGEEPLLIVVRDEDRRPSMILPLVLRRRLFVGIASFAGGKHANYCMPVLRRDICIDKALMNEVWLRASALRRDIDVFVFNALPLAWDGIKNPLVNDSSKPYSASSSIISVGERLIGRQEFTSGRKRRKLNAGERHFASFSPTFLNLREEPTRLSAVVAEFARQKADWARAKRQPNAFEQCGINNFIIEAMSDPSSNMDLHWLEVGRKVIAVAATATSCNRTSLMFVSYDANSRTAPCSPGLRLIKFVVSDAKRRGIETFDFGLGEAEYKARLQAVPEPVYVTSKPMSCRGLVAAVVLDAARRLRIVVKSHTAILASLRQGQTYVSRVCATLRRLRRLGLKMGNRDNRL